MNYSTSYSTVYIGIDAHKESFSLCCYTNEKEQPEYPQRVDAHYSKVINYIEAMRFHYGEDALFVCGYEAGCLGYTLYHELGAHNVKCVILAPSTMPVPKGKKRIKTDKRDAALIARCLAHNDYSAVHVPTEKDEQTKEYIRMRDDHKLELKKVKQQILAFCLRHGCIYDGTKSHWTQTHINWLRNLNLDSMLQEIMDEYLLTYDYLTGRLGMIEKRIEELANDKDYAENVHKAECFIGIKSQTALAVIAETGDFNRFPDAQHYASFLGLAPGEDSSGDGQNRLGITKAGNRHIRTLLIEAAQSYGKGKVGYKSTALKARQAGNSSSVIAYADKANERMRRKYYHMVIKQGKKANVAKTAVARELACFLWGMMTGHIV